MMRMVPLHTCGLFRLNDYSIYEKVGICVSCQGHRNLVLK